MPLRVATTPPLCLLVKTTSSITFYSSRAETL